MGQEDKSDMMSLKARVAQALNAEREKDEGWNRKLTEKTPFKTLTFIH